jgi:amino acid transporter
VPPIPNEFHMEEYRQIRSEVVALVEKVDKYFKFIVLVPTGVYSWLVGTSMGTYISQTATSATACLKIPLALAILGWLIPPVFVIGCGLILRAFASRISQMGAYLRTLEDALGDQVLGWEKFNERLAPKLTEARRTTWVLVFTACIAVSLVGIVCSVWFRTYCPIK